MDDVVHAADDPAPIKEADTIVLNSDGTYNHPNCWFSMEDHSIVLQVRGFVQLTPTPWTSSADGM